MYFAATVACVCVFVTCIVHRKYIQNFFEYRHKISKLPEALPMALPFIGHSYLAIGKRSDFFHFMTDNAFKTIDQSRSKIIMAWLGPVPLLEIYHPDAAQVILKGSKHMMKASLYRFLHPWLGTGLLTSEGEKWKQRRRLITPSFHFNILQDFLDVMNEQSQIMIENITKNYEAGESVDLSQAVTMCALDIICQTAMGKTVNAQIEQDSLYVKSLHRITDLVQLRQKTPILWWDFAFQKMKLGKEHDQILKTLHGFTRNIIEERMSSKAESKNKGKRMAFLDILMHAETEEGKSLSLSDIQEEVDTFMFEGHDTTAAAMTWAIYLIGRHPAVQRRIQEELVKVFANDVDRSITMDDLRELVYLEQVIKEALRLFPSVPLMARVTTEDCQIDGNIVPAGMQVLLHVYVIHRHPDIWKDPGTFDPDRFTTENSAGRHPFAFIPFSAGPRNCIGQKFVLQEEKVILAQLLRRFTVTSNDRQEDLKMVGDLILRPATPLSITISKKV